VGAFPSTRRSLLAGVASDDHAVRRRSLDAIARVYTLPLLEHVRRRWPRPDAEARELVQAFWARAVDKEYLASFVAEKGRFRTFLRVCVDRFAANATRDARRAQRRGQQADVALEDIEEMLASSAGAPDEELERAFERAFRKSVFDLAIADLRADYARAGRERALRPFELYDLAGEAPPTYGAIAAALGVPVTTVTKQLHAARRDFRAHVVARTAEITSGDRELEDELALLFGGG
jgi:RNA polymerase sigma factor (sigma-70 family)